MKKHGVITYIGWLVLFLVSTIVAQIIGTLLFSSSLKAVFHGQPQLLSMWGNFVIELVALLIWWLINRGLLKVNVGWRNRGSSRGWLLLLPVLVVIGGDALLPTSYNLTPSYVGSALLVGLSVGLLEEYVFRGLLVGFFYENFRLSSVTVALLSGVGFGLVHAVNGLSSGNWLNTGAQVLMAMGIGFFLAAVYLITHNLWLPILFHGLVDAFDQVAFGTLSNNAGTSLTNSVVYAVVFLALGLLVLQRGTVQFAQTPAKKTAKRQQHTAAATLPANVSATKSILAVAAIVVELILGDLSAKLSMSKTSRTIFVVLLGLAVCVWVVSLYRDVLGAQWRQYRQHFWRNFAIDFGLMIGVYVLLAVVRFGMKQLPGASTTAMGVTDWLSFQTVASASLAFLSSLVVMMAPFTEEVVFRHVLFYQWRNNKAVMVLMFVFSSVAFGLIHWNNFDGQVMQMVPYMFIGAFFALIYAFSRNIWQNIMTHLLFNSLQFLSGIFLLVFALLQR